MAAARVYPEELSSMVSCMSVSQGPSEVAAAIKCGDAARALALLEVTVLQAVECPWGAPFSRCPKGCTGALRDDDHAVGTEVETNERWSRLLTAERANYVVDESWYKVRVRSEPNKQ